MTAAQDSTRSVNGVHGRQAGRLLLLALPVLFGLLGMHALVVAPATDVTGVQHSSAAAASTPVPGALDTAVTSADAAGRSAPSGHGGHDGGPGHLLHLCLAVLAGVGVVLLAAVAVLGLVPLATPMTCTRRWARSLMVARPPPVSRRLAQLCVMRN